ncbi:cupin domain-containing protein [Glycocaulis profundi]|nr:cupin domain-containing protein [Glycocaulis profundi]
MTAARPAADIEETSGTRYPPPHDAPCRARAWRALGDAFGLSQFGVNLVRLEPGVWSSQRHWHALEDEFVYVLEGAPTLATDAGEQVLGPGDCAGFAAGVKDGHVLKNLSDDTVLFLVVGSRIPEDHGEYSDIDMKFLPGRSGYAHKDGTPF